MKPGTIVATMPARSGGDILFGAKLKEKAKDRIFAAVTPASAKDKALGILQGLLGVFPLVIESPNNLGISLRNPGMVVHPGVMYGRWGPESWDGKPKSEKPLFYQGVDDFTEKILTQMTDEVQQVCRKMEALVPGLILTDACTLKQWYMDSYEGQMSDTTSLKACMNTNSAYKGLTHPCKGDPGNFMPDLQYRYLAEDVPTGLCFSKGWAEIIGIKTPTIDKVMM